MKQTVPPPLLAAVLGILFAAGQPLRAQTITSIYDTTVPGAHAYVIGFTTAGSDVYVHTTETYYTSPSYSGGLSFTKSPLDYANDLNIRLLPTNFVATNPAAPNTLYLSGGLGASNLLYAFQISPPAQTNVPFQSLTTKPLGLGWSPTLNTVVVTTGASELRSVNLADGATTVIDTSAAGALSAPGQVAEGPDGRLYFLDTGNSRVVGIDPTGNLSLRTFSLVGTAEASALAISASGVLFTANGNGGGDAYDLTTGSHLASLVAGSTGDASIGKTSLLLSGNDLYLFDAATNLHVYDVSSLTAVPEPSTYAAVLGLGALGFALWRRKRLGDGQAGIGRRISPRR